MDRGTKFVPSRVHASVWHLSTVHLRLCWTRDNYARSALPVVQIILANLHIIFNWISFWFSEEWRMTITGDDGDNYSDQSKYRGTSTSREAGQENVIMLHWFSVMCLWLNVISKWFLSDFEIHSLINILYIHINIDQFIYHQ